MAILRWLTVRPTRTLFSYLTDESGAKDQVAQPLLMYQWGFPSLWSGRWSILRRSRVVIHQLHVGSSGEDRPLR